MCYLCPCTPVTYLTTLFKRRELVPRPTFWDEVGFVPYYNRFLVFAFFYICTIDKQKNGVYYFK